MAPSVKKRRTGQMQHGAAAVSRCEAVDPRFRMDSSFQESDDDLDGAGPGPGSAATNKHSLPRHGVKSGAVERTHERSAKLSNHPGSEGSGFGAPPVSSGGVGEMWQSGESPGGSGDRGGSGDELQAAGDAAGGYSGDGGDGTVGIQGEEELQQRQQKKVLRKRKLERVKEAADCRGIVYISRIPPHMKPQKLRQLLEPFGDIGRVYCAPEDPALRRLRKKKGGNSGKNFTEGWVEFEDKRRAKRAALALNGQSMGGSKRSAYHYDLWNIKYLPKFKWDTLTEEINYQRAVHEQRLVAEISAAKRERDFYLSRVDKAKAIEAIKERRATKQQQQQAPSAGAEEPPAAGGGATGGTGAGGQGPAAVRPPRLERHFGQRRAKADPVLDDSAPVLAEDVLGLLGRRTQ